MTTTVNIFLPLNTYVNVYSFTNAAFMQQLTILEENGTNHVLTGNGEHNTPFPNGDFVIQTPSTSSNPTEGYKVTVSVKSQQNGSWVPSQITSGKTSLMYFNMALIVSEDYTDQDWNDSVAQFCWWTPPSAR